MASVNLKAEIESALGSRFGTPFRIREKPAPRLLPTGVEQLDAAIGGLPRGALTEIIGPASSGRTTLLTSILSQSTARQEACALVDTSDAFDPATAAAAGVDLRRLLWVRCASDKAQALRVTDLLIQGGGFGLIVLDLADIVPRDARRIPLSTWFRYRRAVEHTPTAFVVVGQEAYAAASSQLVIKCERGARSAERGTRPSHAVLLHTLNFCAAARKPVSSTALFTAEALA